MKILNFLNQDKLYFILLFISLAVASYLSIYFSLVYDKPGYIPQTTPFFYIPFFFISILGTFLIPQIFFGYFFKDKKPFLIFLFGSLFYMLVFLVCSLYFDSFWIEFHQFSAFCVFSFIVSYCFYVGVRGIFSDEE